MTAMTPEGALDADAPTLVLAVGAEADRVEDRDRDPETGTAPARDLILAHVRGTGHQAYQVSCPLLPLAQMCPVAPVDAAAPGTARTGILPAGAQATPVAVEAGIVLRDRDAGTRRAEATEVATEAGIGAVTEGGTGAEVGAEIEAGTERSTADSVIAIGTHCLVRWSLIGMHWSPTRTRATCLDPLSYLHHHKAVKRPLLTPLPL